MIIGVDVDDTLLHVQDTRKYNKAIYTGHSKERWIAFFDAIRAMVNEKNIEVFFDIVSHRKPGYFVTTNTPLEEKQILKTAQNIINATKEDVWKNAKDTTTEHKKNDILNQFSIREAGAPIATIIKPRFS